MLVHRILAAVTLGTLSVSALPGRAAERPHDFDVFAGLDQEPLAQWEDFARHGNGDDLANFAPHRPHRPPPPPGAPWNPDASGKTIYNFLKDDEHFTRLFKLVNFTNEIINTLNDSTASLTLFAPPNSALQPPKRRHAHRCASSFIPADDLEACFHDEHKDSDPAETFAALEELVDEKHDDHKKEILKRIVGAILSYHILPHSLAGDDLAKNTTFGTSYAPKDGAFDGKPLRIHVQRPFRLLHPTLVVNFYAHVLKPDIQATNGYVHVTNHPVLPPPAAFSELFLFTDHFSTFTSALQRVGLTDAADWRYVPGKGDEKGTIEGSPAVTIFAPINSAFKKLPWKLRLFLFSPFGERVLGKLLQFHVVPDLIAHSDYFHNATDSLVARNPEPECCMDADLNELNLFGLHESTYMDLENHLKQPSGCGHPLMQPGGEQIRAHILQNHAPATPGRASVLGYIIDKFGITTDAATGTVVGRQIDFNPHARGCKCAGTAPPHHPDPIYARHGHLPTLLTNHTLHVHVAQYEHKSPIPPHHSSYVTKVVANGVVVKVADVPARNGAVHVIDKLLNPRGNKGGHRHHPGGKHPGGHDSWASAEEDVDEWEGWEDWLVKWADEN